MIRQLNLTINGRCVRATRFPDRESRVFSDEFSAAMGERIALTVEQSYEYFESSSRELYLVQIRSQGKAAFQCVIHVGRSKKMPFFAMATVPGLGQAINEEEEEAALEILREVARRLSGVMSLRLQPQRLKHRELLDFAARASRKRYHLGDAQGITRTLVLPLKESQEALCAGFTRRTRQKIRHRSRDQIELRVLDDPQWIPACRAAETISRGRTGALASSYDFECAFKLAKRYPDRARIVGLFMKNKPNDLLAYVTAFRHGGWAEYSSAGAVHTPELRSIPFNYFLVLELIDWARSQGSVRMNLGGVTDGGSSDPLGGISRFKRSLTKNEEDELETGREFVHVVRPVRFFIYKLLKAFQAKESADNDVVDQGQAGAPSEHPVSDSSIPGYPASLAG